MIINPTSINGKKCKNFNGCNIEDLSVLAGGYIITPYGEVILVGDNETHQQVFSDYINEYLENSQYTVFNTLNATVELQLMWDQDGIQKAIDTLKC